ncbi:MAG: SDR family oxidoreductase [Gammaproteobacteria bacterium]|nr:SDR family oxidoreductase [Gammaproteobacteria bacterium]
MSKTISKTTSSAQSPTDPYHSYSEAELAELPCAYRDDLFKDQVVLISGAAGGIGTACAVLFARLGATVVGCGRSEGPLKRLEENLGALGFKCWTAPMTIRDPDAVSDMVSTVLDREGRLDVLVNNAGGQFAAPALDISPKGWHAVVDTNLNGTWYMMQAAAKRWVDAGVPGCIVNMASLTGGAFVGIAHTAAARAGEINLSKTLSVEWAPHNIRVNCIAIGKIASPGLKNYPESAEPYFDSNSMRRLGDVNDVAQAAVYLAGPTGAFVTGSVLTVDGGEDVWGEYWPLGKPDYFKTD